MNTEPNKEDSENLEVTSEQLKEVSGGQGEDFKSNQSEDLKFKPSIWVGDKKE